MKTSIYVLKFFLAKISLFIYLLAGAILSSCVQDEQFSPLDSLNQGQHVTINLDVASALVTDEGDAADRVVSSLRVLIYHSSNGELVFNIPVDIPTPSRIDIRTGTYDFIFIANEDSDPALKAHLTSVDDADINTLNKLLSLSFERTAFDVAEDIPMVKLIEQVEVSGDNTIRTPEMSAAQTGTWIVSVDRVAIRLKLSVTMTPSQYLEWAVSPKITLSHITGKAFVLPGTDNSAFQEATGEEFAASLTAGATPGVISTPDTDGNVTVTYDRMILPELLLSSANNVESKAMTLSMNFGGKVKSGLVKAADGDAFGYSLPRNTFLKMDATVKEDAIDILAEVLPWGDADMDVIFDGQYTLTVDQTEYYFTSNGEPQPIHISTDYPGGWTVTTTQTWIVMPTQTNNSVGIQTNMDTMMQSGTFVISAGNLRKTIHVTKFPSVANITDIILSNSYVGAFWKANQQGERLIRIPRSGTTVDGKWTAIVIDGQDWMHLDTQMTTDLNVGWRTDGSPDETNVDNGNDTGFDAEHSVNGNLKYVTGTLSPTDNYIYFRIGLNSIYSPTQAAPARYGIVLLAYANNKQMQRIWIRQGEGDDYVFSNTDPVPSGGTRGGVCVRFSPYNLTAPAGKMNTELGVNGGVFTAYPSQGGALFFWANNTTAWTQVGAAPGWIKNEIVGFWNTLGATSETCPPNYHRPNNGSITASTNGTDAPQSEVYQSLWLNSQLSETAGSVTNSVSGYYADGYFDRRKILTGTTSSGFSVVSSTDPYNVAYKGRLFYNPTNYASLFIPYAGRRADANVPSGGVTGGYQCMSWTSSRNATTSAQGWFMSIGETYAFMNSVSYACNTIRCVKDEG